MIQIILLWPLYYIYLLGVKGSILRACGMSPVTPPPRVTEVPFKYNNKSV
jgi:hypothetical protein